MKKLTLTLVFLLICGISTINASLITVSGNVTGTWSADTVLVVGDITVPANSNLTIMPGVKVFFEDLYKLFVDYEAELMAVGTEEDTILFDAYITGQSWKGIRFYHASDSSKLKYCHITNGYATGSGYDQHGGAIYCRVSSPSIQNCLIDSCVAIGVGGAIACHDWSNPIISNNIIINNYAYSSGGGIFCGLNSEASIKNNEISFNTSDWLGGGIFCDDYSYPAINNNKISNNSCEYDGGGIHFTHYTTPYMIEFNEISNNTASNRGGGIFINGSDPSMNKNTIAYNLAIGDGGGLYSTGNSDLQLVNCIIWGNIPEQIWNNFTSNVIATYCDIGQDWTGVGNINAYPMFVDPVNSDFHLQEGSPCIDAGDPSSLLDPDNTRTDMGAYYYDQSTGINKEPTVSIPTVYRLYSPQPNPFNPSTRIRFDLPDAGKVSLTVYNIKGQQVATLIDSYYQPGYHSIKWNAGNLSAGMYFARLEAGEFTATQKLLLLK